VAAALEEAERALTAGQPERAQSALARVSDQDVHDGLLARFLDALSRTNRFLNRHRDTVSWIEKRLLDSPSVVARVLFLRARVAALRQLDPQAALDLVDEALAAARDAKDADVTASLLAHASFCAYRRGDARLAARFADEAALGHFDTPRARIDALRAQLFAATASGAIERSLELSRTVRDLLFREGDLAGTANEHNNCAEEYLRLGMSMEALGEARAGGALAARAGHRAVEAFSDVLAARAAAEGGNLDDAITGLRLHAQERQNLIFWLDTVAALAFWLLERGQAADVELALALTTQATTDAAAVGVRHLLTSLHAMRARALARSGDLAAAHAEMALARQAADAADRDAELTLALTMGEVLPPGDPAREVSLRAARSKLLVAAQRREDPWRYCAGVRLNRRVLELSGGVPTDLPGAPR
jgi:hypothetical protein